MNVRRTELARHVLLSGTSLILFVLVAAGFGVRFRVGFTQPYLYDEEFISIPLAREISFAADHRYLPIRGVHHPALPSYVVKTSSAVFGESAAGHRTIHILLGMLSVLLIGRLTFEAFGTRPAIWAIVLLTFNEYHIGVSSLATAKGPHLFFMAIAIFAFGRFLMREKAAWLYLAMACVGFAFYAKEHSVLILPVFGLSLLASSYRHWLRSRHLFGAGILSLLIIAPDLLWNARAPVGPDAERATYADHLSRIGGLGFSPYPLLFFAREPVRWASANLFGSQLPDDVAENPSMNGLLGLLLVGLVCIQTWRAKPGGQLGLFLPALFWFVLMFFLLVKPGRPTFDLDPVAWYWTDVVLFPSAILAGVAIANARGRTAMLLYGLTLLGAGFAVARTTVWWPFQSGV